MPTEAAQSKLSPEAAAFGRRNDPKKWGGPTKIVEEGAGVTKPQMSTFGPNNC